MSLLALRPPIPRLGNPSPRYPRAAASVVVAALSCGCSASGQSAPPASSGAVTAVVTAEPPNEPLVMAGGEGPAPIALDGVHFPEDDAPLDENIGCRGDCPAPWVMAISRKDRNQIEARIRYCDKAASEQGEQNAGALSVLASIDAHGHAQDVTLTPTGEVSDTLASCVRRLVSTAPFAPRNDHARKSGASAPVGRH